MDNTFKIVKIDSKYCDYLRKYDSKVPYNYGKKELRPFIGVLFKIDKMEYFAPLSSPKPKHIVLKNTLDLIRINNGIYGVVNFNNMIPVTQKNYELIDLNIKTDNEEELKRNKLLNYQLRWLTQNKKNVLIKSKILYNLYKEDRLPLNVKKRCCNFSLLEEICSKYNK